ncbi:hypothetical protein QBC37DRAFT_79666 [Rhypophila decipiens]|uniref:Uncharacterized protein n=1 Tax=Rhypophila decipiens TaxID=261697 RepID=A0AAN7B2B6_9PEZI|nr:hypothetical protein QBC37DRAFT_79666 [Rhypophila decipiens]
MGDYQSPTDTTEPQLLSPLDGAKLGILRPVLGPPITQMPAPYFWGKDFEAGAEFHYPVAKGYDIERELMGDGSLAVFEELGKEAVGFLERVFGELDDDNQHSNNDTSAAGSESKRLVHIQLAPDMQAWRDEQLAAGRVLPAKGSGIGIASADILALFGAADFPAPLTTNGTLFGSGVLNMLIGAYDAETLYSNYSMDAAFYYEHGYHRVFPDFEPLLRSAGKDARAMAAFAGPERRAAVDIGLRYIRAKVALEEKHKASLAHLSARLDRRESMVLYLFESSILGPAMEANLRGWDKAAVMADWVFSTPATDVVDVGSDLVNSEVLNSLLNTADVAVPGLVSEPILRRVYDAMAHTCCRMFTHRWAEPGSRMDACLYHWHFVNNRHNFLRRAVLGYARSRRPPGYDQQQREADWGEAFDKSYHTTGFSRVLENACDGGEPCNQIRARVAAARTEEHRAQLELLWHVLVTRPTEYARAGVVSLACEEGIYQDVRLALAKTYALGLVDDLAFVIAHVSQHAWQVNRLYEAAMFGSFLDDGALRGRLDRTDQEAIIRD